MSNTMDIYPVGTELLHVDTQTDRHAMKLSLFAILRTHLKKAPQRKIIVDPWNKSTGVDPAFKHLVKCKIWLFLRWCCGFKSSKKLRCLDCWGVTYVLKNHTFFISRSTVQDFFHYDPSKCVGNYQSTRHNFPVDLNLLFKYFFTHIFSFKTSHSLQSLCLYMFKKLCYEYTNAIFHWPEQWVYIGQIFPSFLMNHCLTFTM